MKIEMFEKQKSTDYKTQNKAGEWRSKVWNYL